MRNIPLQVLICLQPLVKLESVLSMRNYVLNRPAKLNSLNTEMLEQLRPKLEVGRLSYVRGGNFHYCAGVEPIGYCLDNCGDWHRSRVLRGGRRCTYVPS